MATTVQDLDRTFLDLLTDESVPFETAKFLAELATGPRMDRPALLEFERVPIVSEAGMGKTFDYQQQ